MERDKALERQALEMWDLWFPKTASIGIGFARATLERTSSILVYNAPAVLGVALYTDDKRYVLAEGQNLAVTDSGLLTRLVRQGNNIKRQEIWPIATDAGRPVLLKGGKVGKLICWKNPGNHAEWQWQIELNFANQNAIHRHWHQ